MEPAPLALGSVRQNQTYALEPERNPPYTMDIQRIPRSFSNGNGNNANFGNGTPPETESEPYVGATAEVSWPERALSEMQDMLLLLRSDGTVLYASPSCKSITGYESKQFEHDALTRFIHDDDKSVFTRELEECIAAARPLHCHFRFYRPNSSFFIVEAHGHPHMKRENNTCNGVFLVCRPYPTKSSGQLDSFLEHKIENIRLNQRIAKLRAEEEEDLNMGRQSYPKGNTGSASMRQNLPPFMYYDATGSGEENESSDTINTDEAEPRSYGESAIHQSEEMAHIEGIELITGLNFRDGERSHGLSTGIRQAHLTQCDIEIATMDQQARSVQETDRRKRLKGEYLCTDCGASDSPEWRKGPEGPKTLCNACGLRWAKKEKKRQESN